MLTDRSADMKAGVKWALAALLVPAVVFGALALLLLRTSFGDGMPYSVRIGGPAFMYAAYVVFLFANRRT